MESIERTLTMKNFKNNLSNNLSKGDQYLFTHEIKNELVGLY